MRLVHRANYWGETITSSNRDDEVDMDVIWVQLTSKQRGRGCCQGFGIRRVGISKDDLLEYHNGYWNLFYVSVERKVETVNTTFNTRLWQGAL